MTTGEIVPVEGTPMDIRTPTPVGERINDYDFVQLKNGKGYDHNWVLNTKGDVTRKCASLKSPKTGIVLDVYTNEPGIHDIENLIIQQIEFCNVVLLNKVSEVKQPQPGKEREGHCPWPHAGQEGYAHG